MSTVSLLGCYFPEAPEWLVTLLLWLSWYSILNWVPIRYYRPPWYKLPLNNVSHDHQYYSDFYKNSYQDLITKLILRNNIFCYSSVLSFHYTTDGLEPILVCFVEINEKIYNIDVWEKVHILFIDWLLLLTVALLSAPQSDTQYRLLNRFTGYWWWCWGQMLWVITLLISTSEWLQLWLAYPLLQTD